MLREVPPASRDVLRPLFRGYPCFPGCVEAAIEGRMGTAIADSLTRPTAGMLQVDFYFLAGNAGSPAAPEILARLRPGGSAIIAPDPRWLRLLRRTFGRSLQSYTRTHCRAGRWDRSTLDHYARNLPQGFRLLAVETEDEAQRVADDLTESLIANYGSPADFIAHGVGFAIEHAGRYVAAVSSFALSRRTLEVEIFTHRNYRRRGLASALVARMVLHCLDHDLNVSWDAANPLSAALAEKIGFLVERSYQAYFIAREM